MHSGRGKKGEQPIAGAIFVGPTAPPLEGGGQIGSKKKNLSFLRAGRVFFNNSLGPWHRQKKNITKELASFDLEPLGDLKRAVEKRNQKETTCGSPPNTILITSGVFPLLLHEVLD